MLQDAHPVLEYFYAGQNVDYYFVLRKIVLWVVDGLFQEEQFVHRINGPEKKQRRFYFGVLKVCVCVLTFGDVIGPKKITKISSLSFK